MGRIRASAAALVVSLVAARAGAQSDEAQIERGGPPPEPLPASVRRELSESTVLVLIAARPRLRFRFVRRIRGLAPSPNERFAPLLTERLNYRIAPGALVGTLEVLDPWTDYKRQTIRQGIYLIVYALQPSMKEHRGVSEFRDFLLLLPSGEAPAPREEPGRLWELSRRVSGTGHPAVLALVPPRGQGAAPSLSTAQCDVRVLEVQVRERRLALVVSGVGNLRESGADASPLVGREPRANGPALPRRERKSRDRPTSSSNSTRASPMPESRTPIRA